MKVSTTNHKNRTTIHIVCILVFILLQIFTIISGRFGMAPFNGVAIAFQYGVCIVLIQTDEMHGDKVAIVMMLINAIITASAMMAKATLSVLPGVVNIIFYLITIIIIAHFNRRREIENITDMLTGIYNQRGLFKKLHEMSGEGQSYHLVYFTLDNFKAINDNYGPVFGDELLCEVARRISRQMGSDDIIARTGGTEFAVVVKNGTDAKEVADSILTSVRAKTTIKINDAKIDCFLKSYAGIASYPEHSKVYNDVVTYADIAMFEAAQQRSKSAVVFEESMAEAMNRQIELEKHIKEGLERDYFYLVYQPQFYTKDKKLRGFETLIRMKTAEGGLVSPAEFIPVAEKSDLILQIDDYVLDRAMREFKPIVSEKPDIVLSVNVSAKNFGKVTFVETVRELLEKHQFPAKNFEIEITEYCMVNSIDETKTNMNALREMGVKIALDDFGTGYTSLYYLSELPINLLKIDKSLVDDIEISDKRREFVQAIISLGHLMGCEVVSEGVEHETQVGYLRENGCDFIQGFVWGRPLSYEAASVFT